MRTKKHLNLPITEFTAKVNSALAELGSELKITGVTAEEHNHVRFAKINNNLVYTLACVPKRRIIKNLTLIGTGTGSIQSGVNIFYAIFATIMAASDMVKDETTKAAVVLVNGTKPSAVEINGIKYKLMRTQGVGAWLTVEAADAKEERINEKKL